jgi:hypothetical protein
MCTHARSVVACAFDDVTGEMTRARLVPQPEAILDWLRQLPGPVAVVYAAGPTGFGLARFLTEHGLRCLVAAPPASYPENSPGPAGTAMPAELSLDGNAAGSRTGTACPGRSAR